MTQSFFNLNSQAREGEIGIFYGNLLKRLIRADITWSFFPPISSPASPVQMSPIHIDNIVTASTSVNGLQYTCIVSIRWHSFKTPWLLLAPIERKSRYFPPCRVWTIITRVQKFELPNHLVVSEVNFSLEPHLQLRVHPEVVKPCK